MRCLHVPPVLATPRAAPERPQGPGDVGAETQEPLANQGAPSVANTDAGDECQETCLTPRSLDGRLLLQRTEPRAPEPPALSHATVATRRERPGWGAGAEVARARSWVQGASGALRAAEVCSGFFCPGQDIWGHCNRLLGQSRRSSFGPWVTFQNICGVRNTGS